MTTKAKGRKRVACWVVVLEDGRAGSWAYPTEERAQRAAKNDKLREVVHLIESDAAELRAMRRVARLADRYVNSVQYGNYEPLVRAVAALKKARR